MRCAAAALALLLLSPAAASAHDAPQAPAGAAATALPNLPSFGGPFSLLDHSGRRVTDGDFRGRLMLVVFGFSHCPDVCPLELATIAAALDLLGPESAEVQPLFITVDPERDTPERLAAWLPSFHPRLLGLTGDAAATAAAARAYRVHTGHPGRGAAAPAEPSHSSFLYLMGRDGRFVALLMPSATPEQIATAIRKHAALR